MSAWPTPTTLIPNVAHTWDRFVERAREQAAKGVNLERPLGTVADAVVLPSMGDGDHAYLSPLVHGATHRVGRLRGYGNSISPQVAQAFIEAYLEAVT